MVGDAFAVSREQVVVCERVDCGTWGAAVSTGHWGLVGVLVA